MSSNIPALFACMCSLIGAPAPAPDDLPNVVITAVPLCRTSDRACYQPSRDVIFVRPGDRRGLAHELTHACQKRAGRTWTMATIPALEREARWAEARADRWCPEDRTRWD